MKPPKSFIVDSCSRPRFAADAALATRGRQRPDAVRRAGADPLDRRERAPPQLLLELRPARLVPRHRARLPPLPARPRRLCVVAGDPRPARRVRPRVPGPGHPEQRPDPLLHRGAAHRGARVADPAGDLRRGRGRDDLSRRGRRPAVPALPRADRLPARPARQPRRHRDLHRPVVRRRPAARVGAGRRRRLRRAAPPPHPAAARWWRWPCSSCCSASSRWATASAGRRTTRSRQGPARRHQHLRQRRPAPDASATSRRSAGSEAYAPCRTSARPATRCATS